MNTEQTEPAMPPVEDIAAVNSSENDPETAKAPRRFTKTVIFSPDEFKRVDEVFTARNESGLSRDYNHFVRQCIDFTINRKDHKSASFAVPDTTPVFLTDAFFKPLK